MLVKQNRCQLLVSVRSLEEAHVAIEGGVDLIDIKEPHRGSLGMASFEVIGQIVQTVRQQAPHVGVSVACGEVNDWNAESPALCCDDIDYLKLGLSQLGNVDWVRRWTETRSRIASMSHDQKKTPRWIAVVYADQLQANSPSTEEIVEAAHLHGCEGVLFDTFSKNGAGLRRAMPREDLSAWVDRIQSLGLRCALAGQISKDDVPYFASLKPDIIAVRTAATASGQRESSIDLQTINELRSALEQNS